MKKLFLTIFLVSMFSACLDNDSCSLVCTDVYTIRDHWENFPIIVYTTNDAQDTVLEYYNTALEQTIFIPTSDIDEAQVVIDDSQAINDGRDDLVAEAATNNHEPAFDGIITGSEVSVDISIDQNSLHYKKVLAHEMGHVLGAQHFCGTIMTPCANSDADDDIIRAIQSPLFLEWFNSVYGE